MDLKLDKETKEKLIGMLPFSEMAEDSYTPKKFIDDKIPIEFRPIFKLRPFNNAEKIKAKTLIKKMAANGDAYGTDDDCLEIIRKVVIGWENYYDIGKGCYIEYKSSEDGGADKSIFKNIPKSIANPLFFRVYALSGILDMESVPL